jgi:hypothetical protein
MTGAPFTSTKADLKLEQQPKASHPRALGHLGTLGIGKPLYRALPRRGGPALGDAGFGLARPRHKLGTYFIELAKTEMKRWFVNLILLECAELRSLRTARRRAQPLRLAQVRT